MYSATSMGFSSGKHLTCDDRNQYLATAKLNKKVYTHKNTFLCVYTKKVYIQHQNVQNNNAYKEVKKSRQQSVKVTENGGKARRRGK